MNKLVFGTNYKVREADGVTPPYPYPGFKEPIPDSVILTRKEVEGLKKEIKLNLLWELIEDFQDARDKGEDISDPKYSSNDIEVEFYNKMEEIDPNAKQQHLSSIIKPKE